MAAFFLSRKNGLKLLGILVGYLLTALLPAAHAAPLPPRATLLISLDTTEEQKKFLIGPLYKNYSLKIERKFRHILDQSGLELHVIDRADLHDLDRELRNPANAALFWISHASDPRQILNAPLGALDPVILDAHGSDIKQLFAHPHPNLRWLSVIACSSGLILDETGEVISEENPPELEKGQSVEVPDVAPGIPALMVQRFTSKKGALAGMAHAARQAKGFFQAVPEVRAGYQLNTCPAAPMQTTLELNRTRITSGEHPALALLWNQRRVGSIAPLLGEAQTQSFDLDSFRSLLERSTESRQALLLEVSSLFVGARKLANNFALGDIRIHLRIRRPPPYARDLEIPLQRVEKRPGVPLGTVTHLFELKLTEEQRNEMLDSLALLNAPETIAPCPALAPFAVSREVLLRSD